MLVLPRREDDFLLVKVVRQLLAESQGGKTMTQKQDSQNFRERNHNNN